MDDIFEAARERQRAVFSAKMVHLRAVIKAMQPQMHTFSPELQEILEKVERKLNALDVDKYLIKNEELERDLEKMIELIQDPAHVSP